MQRLEFALGVAPVQEFIDQFAVDLALAVVAHPDFLEPVDAQKQAQVGDVLPVILVRVLGDEPVAPRLADDEPLDEWPHQPRGPAGQRAGLHGQAHAGAAQGAHGLREMFGIGREPGLAEFVPVMVHAAEHAAGAVQIEGGIDGILRVLGWWFGLEFRLHGI